MWSNVSGYPLNRAAMFKDGFEFLVACMRIENLDKRGKKKEAGHVCPQEEGVALIYCQLWQTLHPTCKPYC